jgi:hypothetical protein
MVSFEIIALVLTGVGIMASIIYYANILQNANQTQKMQLETRQTQLFMYLYDKFCSESFKRSYYEIMRWEWTDYHEYAKKYGPDTNPEKNLTRGNVGSFFEGLGVLIKNKQISPELVDDLISQHIITYWEKFGPIMKEARIRLNYPHAAEWVEYLYNQIKPIYIDQHPELAI